MLNSLDLLYIVLAIGIALLSIFVSVALVYTILILRDVNKASEAIKDSAERMNAMIMTPIKLTHEALKYAKPVIDVANKKIQEQAMQNDKPQKKKSAKSNK